MEIGQKPEIELKLVVTIPEAVLITEEPITTEERDTNKRREKKPRSVERESCQLVKNSVEFGGKIVAVGVNEIKHLRNARIDLIVGV